MANEVCVQNLMQKSSENETETNKLGELQGRKGPLEDTLCSQDFKLSTSKEDAATVDINWQSECIPAKCKERFGTIGY